MTNFYKHPECGGVEAVASARVGTCDLWFNDDGTVTVNVDNAFDAVQFVFDSVGDWEAFVAAFKEITDA